VDQRRNGIAIVPQFPVRQALKRRNPSRPLRCRFRVMGFTCPRLECNLNNIDRNGRIHWRAELTKGGFEYAAH
jgi:hypothetical protein